MKYFALIGITLFFSACVTTKVPAKSEYRINTELTNFTSDSSMCKDKTLKVAQAFSDKNLMVNDMMYTQGNYKQFFYASSQWAQTPNDAITTKFLSLMRNAKLFQNVQIAGSRSKNDFILEVHIEDFMQYFNADITSSFANAKIHLSLIDATNREIYASESFSAKIDVNTLDAQGGVEGLSIALTKILNDSGTWIAKVCK